MVTWVLKNYVVEYLEEEHLYLIDGEIVPSITQIMSVKFGRKYDYVDDETLNKAAELGTQVHQAIEDYCKNGTDSELPELRNFKFLQEHYGFLVKDNEVPVILFDKEDKPIACGRLDLVIEMLDGEDYKLGIADIKRTSALDKNYLGYQLNLYRLAYMKTYDANIEMLKGIHLREEKRRFVDIPINEDCAYEIIEEYFRSE